jgi:hypothetical protein
VEIGRADKRMLYLKPSLNCTLFLLAGLLSGDWIHLGRNRNQPSEHRGSDRTSKGAKRYARIRRSTILNLAAGILLPQKIIYLLFGVVTCGAFK